MGPRFCARHSKRHKENVRRDFSDVHGLGYRVYHSCLWGFIGPRFGGSSLVDCSERCHVARRGGLKARAASLIV